MANLPQTRPLSIRDIDKIEDVLQVRVAVVSAKLGNKFVRIPGNSYIDRPLLYIYLEETKGLSHFHAITSIPGCLSSVYFCEKCFKPYNTKANHYCKDFCVACHATQCVETRFRKTCQSCNMTCYSNECYTRHATTAKNGSICDRFWQCIYCKKNH